MKAFQKEFKKNWFLFLMLVPSLILIILLSYIPMSGIVVAFKNFKYNAVIFGAISRCSIS